MKKCLLTLLVVIGFCVAVGILVSRSASRTLVYQGKTVRTWLVQFATAGSPAHEEAEAALNALGTNAVPDLTRLLRTDDAHWRQLIWSHLTALPKPVRKLVLSHVSAPIAHATHPAAAQLLGKLGPAAASAVPALLRMLRLGNPYEQEVATRSLAQIGMPAAAPLIDLLAHEQGAVGSAAGRAVVRLYRWAGQVQTAAEKPSTDPTAPARQRAVERLGASGRTDEIAIRALAGAAQDPAPGVRLAALKVLVQANRDLKPALPQLVACSRDQSPAIREWSARALGKINIPDGPSIPALTQLALDKEASVRVVAQVALETIEPDRVTNRGALPK